MSPLTHAPYCRTHLRELLPNYGSDCTCGMGELLNAPIRFWDCPEQHPRQPLRETVRWVDDVAHCLEPGCGRTSKDE